MFETIISRAIELATVEGFNGIDFSVSRKDFFVDTDSDGTLFITQRIVRDRWEIFIDGIEI